jgi:hypothetical protein
MSLSELMSENSTSRYALRGCVMSTGANLAVSSKKNKRKKRMMSESEESKSY